MSNMGYYGCYGGYGGYGQNYYNNNPYTYTNFQPQFSYYPYNSANTWTDNSQYTQGGWDWRWDSHNSTNYKGGDAWSQTNTHDNGNSDSKYNGNNFGGAAAIGGVLVMGLFAWLLMGKNKNSSAINETFQFDDPNGRKVKYNLRANGPKKSLIKIIKTTPTSEKLKTFDPYTEDENYTSSSTLK